MPSNTWAARAAFGTLRLSGRDWAISPDRHTAATRKVALGESSAVGAVVRPSSACSRGRPSAVEGDGLLPTFALRDIPARWKSLPLRAFILRLEAANDIGPLLIGSDCGIK